MILNIWPMKPVGVQSRHRNSPSLGTHAYEFACDAVRAWGEHGADQAYDGFETAVAERQFFGMAAWKHALNCSAAARARARAIRLSAISIPVA